MSQTSLPLILEPAELEHHLHDSNLLIVDLCNPRLYARVHVPGAVNIAPNTLWQVHRRLRVSCHL
ncbi:rhodanese-like domain-containing protein [Endozoicomonas euniceicola]|uniref:Rhodanese-like domain-containing protein n=1 Tax=Endozoicomonas euniceicola TaxID=1234143 RepID=A0ABY6GZ23_9GAMM|nr:rhodanese-like domain-containing protein [Endozoicomonas euniceicola]UYM17925.1 rhodanese-like domain-containing protein [Endozoicomonas euniceicola]